MTISNNSAESVTPSAKVLTEDSAREIIDAMKPYISEHGRIRIALSSWWGTGQRWARNRSMMNSDQRDIALVVNRKIRNSRVDGLTNQLDPESARGFTKFIEHYAHEWANKTPRDFQVELEKWNPVGKTVWSDATYNYSAMEGAKTVEDITRITEADGLVSAGYIEATGSTALIYTRDEWGREDYHWGRVTTAQCSVTVRHQKSSGSGWTGASSFDMNEISLKDLATRALERCQSSIDPVRIEPGRYQTILEPKAAAALVDIFVNGLRRDIPEGGHSGYIYLGPDGALRRHRSKLDVRIADERITISHDPEHPVAGTHPDNMYARVNLVTKGILTALYNQPMHERNEMYGSSPNIYRPSYVVESGTTTMEEMISSTARGLLVGRLEQVQMLDKDSLLHTGVTRDGLWLIEKGVITKAVRNFRWTESPVFALNNIEQIGISEPVFAPNKTRSPLVSNFGGAIKNTLVPPLKINDFSFTSSIDAI